MVNHWPTPKGEIWLASYSWESQSLNSTKLLTPLKASKPVTPTKVVKTTLLKLTVVTYPPWVCDDGAIKGLFVVTTQ